MLTKNEAQLGVFQAWISLSLEDRLAFLTGFLLDSLSQDKFHAFLELSGVAACYLPPSLLGIWNAHVEHVLNLCQEEIFRENP